MVAEGDWLYDGAVSRPVWIVRTDVDVWFEIAKADDQLEPGEVPRLNDEGHVFYACFQRPVPDAFWPAGGGSPTLDDAKRRAQARVPAGIAWH